MKGKSIEERVRQMWAEGDGGLLASHWFLTHHLPKDLKKRWQHASGDVRSATGGGRRKKWKAIDIRFAKLADKRKGKA